GGPGTPRPPVARPAPAPRPPGRYGPAPGGRRPTRRGQSGSPAPSPVGARTRGHGRPRAPAPPRPTSEPAPPTLDSAGPSGRPRQSGRVVASPRESGRRREQAG